MNRVRRRYGHARAKRPATREYRIRRVNERGASGGVETMILCHECAGTIADFAKVVSSKRSEGTCDRCGKWAGPARASLTPRQREFMLRAGPDGIIMYRGGEAWERTTLFALEKRGLVEFVSDELKDQPAWMGRELKSHDVRLTEAGRTALGK